jgi:hypothetical protein
MEMPDRAPATDRLPAAQPRMSSARLAGLGLALAAVAVVMWGGYGHRWPWTGINGRTATLWDWLHLLLLPAAFGLLPVLLSRETRLRPGHRWAGSAAVLCFVAVVAAGYTIPWGWTGFVGNRLWDWLELLALPLAVTLIPVMDEIRLTWTRRDSIAAAIALAGLAAIVIGGYVGDWTWTGFRGNTLWDWLHLLLLPLLLPTVIVPRLVPKMKATLIVAEESQRQRSRAEAVAVEVKPAQAGPAPPEHGESASPAPPPVAQPSPDGSLDDVQKPV